MIAISPVTGTAPIDVDHDRRYAQLRSRRSALIALIEINEIAIAISPISCEASIDASRDCDQDRRDCDRDRDLADRDRSDRNCDRDLADRDRSDRDCDRDLTEKICCPFGFYLSF